MSYDPEVCCKQASKLVCCYLDPFYVYMNMCTRRSRVILCLLPRWQLNVNVVILRLPSSRYFPHWKFVNRSFIQVVFRVYSTFVEYVWTDGRRRVES